VQEQILRDLGTEDNEEALYHYMLEACEKLFMNELDQAMFEEHMRWFFGTKVSDQFPCLNQEGSVRVGPICRRIRRRSFFTPWIKSSRP